MLRLFAFLMFLIVSQPVWAEENVTLNAEQQELLQKLHNYLNTLKTLQGSFAQISSNGAYADGKVWMSRPGQMRLIYNPPARSELIVRNGTIIYHDQEFKQVSYYPLDATPLAVLLQEKLSFDQDVRIIDLAQGGGVIELTLIDRDDPGMGSVTLVFSQSPLELRKWTVIDAQGLMTQVSLLNADFGAKIQKNIFDFTDPQYNKVDN